MGEKTEKDEAREFDFTYRIAVPPLDRKLRIWTPCPQTDAHQEIGRPIIEIDSPPASVAIEFDPVEHNKIAVIDLPPDTQARNVKLVFRVKRKPRYSVLPSAKHYSTNPSTDAELARFLQPNAKVPTDDFISETAFKVTSTDDYPIVRARKLFDYLLLNYDYNVEGCTPEMAELLGDLPLACSTAKATCTDFHGLFVGYCRSVGVPARFAFGFNVKARAGGKIPGYHCWSELYLPDGGWLPFDVSEAWKRSTPEERSFYFGNIDQNRVQFTMGRDLVLTPKQAGGAVDKFIFPHVEAEGEFVDLDTVVPYFRFDDKLIVER